MAVTCRGICDQFKIRVSTRQPRYSSGFKRCTLCAAYFTTVDTRCPCCKTKLRTRPRSKLRI
ncbi:MAG: hypothetical protein CXX67_00145 [Thaumarchaeota archaeon]|nr:MAG: hypothetical protein CXX67_00145 [Nitrososphaerota archaeon]HIA96755.1 hypothetical protein [Candidatus Nitrosopelagicus sp.]HIO85432.1 hypothetical protein [Candidatus Nitrosopelagicus sp.]